MIQVFVKTARGGQRILLKGIWTTCERCGNTFVSERQSARRRRFCGHGCANSATAKGRAMSGARHPKWKGGRWARDDGYMMRWVGPDVFPEMQTQTKNYILEHRYVMACEMGRPLVRAETVHHKNGNRSDNRIENLEFRVGAHGPGSTHSHCHTCTCFAEAA